MLTLYGFSVFALFFGGILRANARRWRYLATVFAAPTGQPIETRSMQSGVFLGLGGFNSLNGILTFGLHKDGVSIRVSPLFSLFHAPLFIPYADIQGWKTTWYLDAPSVELEFRGAPDVKLVVPAELAKWMQGRSAQRLAVHDVAPPNGKAGRGWYGFSLFHAAMSLVMLVWLTGIYLSQWVGN